MISSPEVDTLQDGSDGGGKCQGAALAVLRGDHLILAPAAPDQLQLLINCDGPFGKVHTIPQQPQSLALSHSREQGDVNSSSNWWPCMACGKAVIMSSSSGFSSLRTGQASVATSSNLADLSRICTPSTAPLKSHHSLKWEWDIAAQERVFPARAMKFSQYEMVPAQRISRGEIPISRQLHPKDGARPQ